jgi:hypothetical protein
MRGAHWEPENVLVAMTQTTSTARKHDLDRVTAFAGTPR